MRNALVTFFKVIMIFCSLILSVKGQSATDYDDFFSLPIEELLKLKISVASNFTETELEVASTVEVILNNQWKDYGAENISEAISHLPATMVYPVPWGGSAIAIRGYASSLSIRGIAVVMDGMPMNTLRNGSALYEIRGYTAAGLDRIEMIRGPGSALYGSDAFHGVLSMKTYESKIDKTQVNFDSSSEGFRQANFNFTKINNTGISFNASVTGIDQSAQDILYSYTIPGTDNVAESERANSYDAYMGVFKLGIDHSDSFKTSYGLYVKGNDSIESISGGQSQSTFGSIFLDRDITDGADDLKAVKFAFEKHLAQNISFEGKLYNWQSKIDIFTDISTLIGFGRLVKGEEHSTGLDLILKQPDNAWRTQWTVGLSYKTGEIKRSDQYLTTATPDRSIQVNLPPESILGFDRNVKSLILSAKTKFLEDKFQLVYGGRMDNYSDFGNQTTPRLGIIYLPTTNSSIKVLYGEAFRAPVSVELFGAGQLKGNLDLDPELIKTNELVYMYNGDFWKINLTYFESQWTDGIILNPINEPGFTAEYTNIGQNESDGFELTYRGSLNQWRWDLSGSWVSSQANTENGDIDYVAFPQQIYNLNFGYTFIESSLDLYVTNRLQLSTKEGPISSNVPNPNKLDDYSTTDMTLDWTINQQWNLQLGIRNLLDKENFSPSVWNNENGIRNLGRYFQANFSYTL